MRYETLILIFIVVHKGFSLCMWKFRRNSQHCSFAFDHVNYSWWMSVHIMDTKSLTDTIDDEFDIMYHWVISKTTNKFSSHSIRLMSRRTRLRKVLVVLLGSPKTPLLLDDGCAQGRRLPGCRNSLRKNTYRMMSQRHLRTSCTMSRVSQHRTPSRHRLLASLKPSDEWTIHSWMISRS